jgi:hypothetical protein
MATTGAVIGALYLTRDDSTLSLVASLGANRDADHGAEPIAFGEGLVGKAALTGQAVAIGNLENTSVRARTGILEIIPRCALVFPIATNEKVVAVVELAFTGDQAVTGLELLRVLHNDLAEGLRQVNVLPPTSGAERPETLRDLQEELIIINSRLEHSNREMAVREGQVRLLQTEIDTLRKRPAGSPR